MEDKDKDEVASIVRGLIERDLDEPMRVIARRHNLTLEEVLAKRRAPGLVQFAAARGEMYRYVRERFGWSYPFIGKVFGRDHSNVMVTLRRQVRGQ